MVLILLPIEQIRFQQLILIGSGAVKCVLFDLSQIISGHSCQLLAGAENSEEHACRGFQVLETIVVAFL